MGDWHFVHQLEASDVALNRAQHHEGAKLVLLIFEKSKLNEKQTLRVVFRD